MDMEKANRSVSPTITPMEYIKQKTFYKPGKKHFDVFLKKFWFVPSDILQRGIEANIWELCSFKHPILDIGVGNGEISTYLFSQHQQMDVGIDMDDSQFAQTIATNKYKKVIKADAQHMPFADNSFTTVVSNSTFEHITDDKKAVSEVARVLKKGGLFYITVPSNYLQEWVLAFEKKRNKKKAKQKLKRFNKRTNHIHYHSLEEWKKLFTKNNMELVFFKYYFPKHVALKWYMLLTLATRKFRGRELWSYLSHSKFTPLLPKKAIQYVLRTTFLEKTYQQAFFQSGIPGGQLFMIAKKKE